MSAIKKIFNRIPKRLLRILLVVAPPALAIAFFMIMVAGKPPVRTTGIAPERLLVEAVEFLPKQLAPQLRLFGEIVSHQRARISLDVSGRIAKVKVRPGDVVEAGQSLVELNQTRFDLALERAQNSFDEAQLMIRDQQNNVHLLQSALKNRREVLRIRGSAARRGRQLYEAAAITIQEMESRETAMREQQIAFDQADTSLKAAGLSLQRLRHQLSRADADLREAQFNKKQSLVDAPFAGRVLMVPVAAGDMASPGTPLVEIYGYSHIEIRAQIEQKYLPIFEGWRREQISGALNLAGNRWQLSFARLAATADPQTGGLDAYFRIQGPLDQLAIGRKVSIDVSLPPVDNSYAIAAQAIFNGQQVYRINDQQQLDAQPIEILGSWGENGFLITGPNLKEGDRIMITRLPNPLSGQEVRVRISTPL